MAKGYLEAQRRVPSTYRDPKPGSGAHRTIEATQRAVSEASGNPGEGSTRPKPTKMTRSAT